MLLVEDERRLRTVVSMMLEELGVAVVAVAGGDRAVEALRAEPQTFDVALLDLKLQGTTGVDVYRRLAQLEPALRVVFSSGVSPGPDAQQIIEEKAGGFIEKPYTIERLEEVLEQMLRH